MCGGKKAKHSGASAAALALLPTTVPMISDQDDALNSTVPHIATLEELEEILRKAPTDQLVVLDFYAKWCGPCMRVAPIIEHWVMEFPDVQFVKVDVDTCSMGLPEQFSIQSIPTFILFKHGRQIDEFLGSKHPVLRHLIESHRNGIPPRPSVMDNLASATPMTTTTAAPADKNSKKQHTKNKGKNAAGGKTRISAASTASREPTHVPLRQPTKVTRGSTTAGGVKKSK